MDIDFDIELYNKVQTMPIRQKSTIFKKREKIGKGVSGTVFFMDCILPNHDVPLVLKIPTSKHALNEIRAHKYLCKKMLSNEIPHYFPLIYADYIYKGKRHVVMERCDGRLYDDVFVEDDLTESQYLDFFYQLADAIECLETIEFNHGDLWTDNIMIWITDIRTRICIIDFDASFKKGVCDKPALGYTNDYRTKFYIGYDLNRFFDEILHYYKHYIKERQKCKNRKRKERLKKQQKEKNGSDLDESDSEIEQYDQDNPKYPPKIIKFIESLPLYNPEEPKQWPQMSGNTMKERILNFAKEQGIAFEPPEQPPPCIPLNESIQSCNNKNTK